MAEWHLATAYEIIADTVGDQPALICDNVIRTWTEYDDRASRIAGILTEHGVAAGAKVGIYLHNCNEYQEVHHGINKLRGCPVNINYRYKEEELVYLLNNADAEAVVYQSTYAERIETIRGQVDNLKCLIQLADDSDTPLIPGAIDFEEAVSTARPMARIERKADDLYMLYTGGTTGMPKGVMYDNGMQCMGLARFSQFHGVEVSETMEDLPDNIIRLQTDVGLPRGLVCCPLMHGTGMWVGSIATQLAGGAAITVKHLGLKPDELWMEAQQHRATMLTIVGDAFARPMLGSLNEAHDRGKPYDISSIKLIISSGVMWSQDIKEGLLKHNDMTLIDAMGSTEGSMGSSISTRESAATTAKFEPDENMKVFNENNKPVEPGSGEIGMIATQGSMIGYYKDPKKTAQTVREIDGERYIFPGDFATIEADGGVTLLGRGSMCINTAGEKVFPEEVEEVIKKHSGTEDCLVVGVPDSRFGERVVSVVSRSASYTVSDASLLDHCHEHLAGYKVPKNVLFVDQVQRAPNGKADYKWAKSTALHMLEISE